MGKYTGSPWGVTRGKTGQTVGSVWKGIPYQREVVVPRNASSIRKYDTDGTGCIRGITFSYLGMNFRRAVFGMLSHTARMTHNELIKPVWQTLCTQRGLKMTGLNRFVEQNARLLWKSMRGNILFSPTNLPDMSKMLVSDGNLEPSQEIWLAYYSAFPPFGVTINWDTTIYRNGSPNDDAWIAVYARPSSDNITAMNPYGVLYVRGSGVTRSAGAAFLPTPASFPGDLTAFVFFSDGCGNYSPSVARRAQVAP